MALFEEVISDHRQVELGGNQDVNLITDAAVLEIRETTKIRELYRALSEIPETAKAKELKVKQEVAKEWKEMEEIQEANSADQIYQLEALRFKMKSMDFNLPSSRSVEIAANEMPGMRKEMPIGETFSKYGDSARRVEIESIEKHGTFIGIHLSEIPDVGSLIEGRFVYTVGNKPISACRKKKRRQR